MKRVYRTYGQAAAIALVGLIFPGIAVATVVSDPRTSSGSRWGVLLFNLLLAWFVVWRVARARVCVLSRGVRIFNPLRSVFLPWDKIESFSLHPWGLIWSPIGHAELKGGEAVHIFGIAAPSAGRWPKKQSAEKAIAELNEILETAHSGHPPD
jgi:hypothetical protein